MSYKLRDEDYFEIWKYFEDRADNVKEAMFKTLTWTVGFAAALLGFIFVKLTDYDKNNAVLPLRWVVFLAALAGLVICLYSSFTLSEAGKHIRNNWKRARRCEGHVQGLKRILLAGRRREPKSIEIWDRLRIIVILFVIAFVLAGISAWIVPAARQSLPAGAQNQQAAEASIR